MFPSCFRLILSRKNIIRDGIRVYKTEKLNLKVGTVLPDNIYVVNSVMMMEVYKVRLLQGLLMEPTLHIYNCLLKYSNLARLVPAEYIFYKNYNKPI